MNAAELLSHAFEQSAERMASLLLGQKLEQLKLPEFFSQSATYQGETLEIQPRAFRGSGIDYARIVRVSARESLQVLNCVVFPAPGLGLPIYGCEILSFKKGLHLFVLDAFPMSQNPSNAPFLEMLEGWRNSLDNSVQLPEWGEGVFSPKALIYKPKPKQQPLAAEELMEKAVQLLQVTLGAALHTADLQQETKARNTYLREHAKHEPARPFLERVAGAEWAQQFIQEFLFPAWLQHNSRPAWYGLKPGVMDNLKNETTVLHKAAEALPFSRLLLQEKLPLDRYLGQLQAYQVVYEALEQIVANSTSLHIPAVWDPSMARLSFLNQDVAFFDTEPTPPATKAILIAKEWAQSLKEAALVDPLKILGSMYVLEGSSMGSTFLKPRLESAFHLQEGGLAYFSASALHAGRRWNGFKSRIQALFSEDQPQGSVLQGAHEAFHYVLRILEALSAELKCPA